MGPNDTTRPTPPTMTGEILLTLERRAFRDRPASQIRISLDEFPPGNPLVRLQVWTVNARTGDAWPEREKQVTIRRAELADVVAALQLALERVGEKSGGAK